MCVLLALQDINALEQHIKNLLSPATPYIFNTLYDPYRCAAMCGSMQAHSAISSCGISRCFTRQQHGHLAAV
jgi:hypothetical protein